VRTTRTRKQKSLTPEPERYSKTVGLGKPWDQPIIYPEVGKKRVTIEFEDLERLDEGVFFNDSLIEFYIRWLKETHPNVGAQTAYFFSTHFYTTLSDYKSAPKNARNRQINYQGVERWTAKDDIFSHDFVVVPVNEHAHWYLAIICNLPNVKRKLESQEDEEDVKVSQDDAAQGTAAQPVTISESAEAQPITVPDSDRQGEAADEPAVEESNDAGKGSTPTKGITKKCDDLALSSPQPETSIAAKGSANDVGKEDANEPQASEVAPAKRTALEEAIEVIDSQATQQDTSQVSEGVFANAAPASPEKKKKGKRKSGPGIRKYETSQPAIVILDPMGTNHPGTITQLKYYLIEEASTKRGMELHKSMFQGINAHQGIPEQKNYYDCGVFVCGYLDKFMRNPTEFGQKLLTQEFHLEVDWPEMRPSKMREQMREMLQGIAKDQQKARLERQKAKRAAKREAAAASSPPKVEDGVVDLSSPVKARDAVKEPQPAKKDAEPPKGVERARSRTSNSPLKRPAPPVAPIPIDEAEEEMLLQSAPDFTSQLQAAADQQDSQSSQKSHVSDSSSDVERIPGGVKPIYEEIKIYEDPPINFEDREPPPRLRSTKSTHYSPDLEL
jgi:sentrin-specific protease 7